MGRRAHSCEALEWLVDQGHEVVRVVAPSGQGSEVPYWSPTLRETANRLGVSVSDFATFKLEVRDGFYAGSGDIDLVISFLFWKRITRDISGLARFGCINFHPAPLPDYKGLGGYNFAILDKLDKWGVTAHYVDDSFDTGPIIEVAKFPFNWRSATALTLEKESRSFTLELFRRVVTRVSQSGWLPTTGNVGGRYLSREDMEQGKRLDLNAMSPDEIELRARAYWYPPFDGAYIELGGQRFTLVPSQVMRQLSELHQE